MMYSLIYALQNVEYPVSVSVITQFVYSISIKCLHLLTDFVDLLFWFQPILSIFRFRSFASLVVICNDERESLLCNLQAPLVSTHRVSAIRVKTF